MNLRRRISLIVAGVSLVGLLVTSCAPAASPQPAGKAASATQTTAGAPAKSSGVITVYSGRAKGLVGPLLDQVAKDIGVEVRVRYGDTAQLAAAILEEGNRTPADVFFAQDAGALGALSKAGQLTKLPDNILNRVDKKFQSVKGEWVGVSGRARVVAYNTQTLKEADLPESIWGFTDPKWKGRIGWPPTNGSFQAFVTAMRVLEGEAKAREWLKGIQANSPKVYRDNTTAIQAVASGEVQVAFINHYYLFGQLKEKGEYFAARNYYPKKGDVGALMNVAGAGILSTAKDKKAAEAFVEYLLSDGAQRYFAEQTYEYPMVQRIPTDPRILPLSQIQAPNIDLTNLDDLNGTLKLMQELGIL